MQRRTSVSVEDQIARALRQIGRAIDLHSRALLQHHGLTVPQLATLLEIERLQPVSAGSLASKLHLGSATLTGVLDRLEQRGLVCRTRHAGDRRSILLNLTDLGTELFASAPSQLCEAFSQRLAKLPEWEQTNILSTLQRVADMMEPCGTGESRPSPVAGPVHDQSKPRVPTA